jgi:hypothetical protein
VFRAPVVQKEIAFLVDPAPAGLRKDYEPFIAMGDGGVLFYSGHFQPYARNGERQRTALTIIAEECAAVSAFGVTAPQFVRWESPFRHPAFIYVGRQKPIESEALVALADAAAPEWVRGEIGAFAPAIAVALRGLFERALPVKPNIFLTAVDLSEEGRLSYRGDALPGQYQMTLSGAAWRESTPEGLLVLRRSTAHEAAHLWQAAARPNSDAAPEWIHEGGADALAAEALVAAGYWTAAERAQNLERSKAECARFLERLSLQRAEADSRWDAVYACGHVINVAAAGKGGVASFWREFTARAAADGYDEAMFVALAEERAGAETAKAIRDLVRINDARSAAAIARLFGEPADLAAGQAR